MAGSFSRELEDLLNPQPMFADPEDDGDERTTARVIDTFAEDEDGEEVGLSVLRRNNTGLLSDIDRRYLGKAVSRKQMMNTERSDEEDEEDISIEDDGLQDDVEKYLKKEDDDDDDDDGDEEDEEGSNAQLNATLSAKTDGCDVSFPQVVDFHRLTEGMDDLGVRENEEESKDEDSDDNEGESAGDEDEDEDEGTICTLSKEKVNEEVEKGIAVKNQLALWDQLLEGRIKVQKVLVTANKLPQPQTFPNFKRRGGAELAGALKNTHKALKVLQRSLLELHDQLLYQNPDTRTIAVGQRGTQSEEKEIDSDKDGEGSVQEREAPKRKLDLAEYPDFMTKRFNAFQLYRNTMLQKWDDRTRLSMGKSNRGFGAFDRNILTQLEQVLIDRERLVRRTQTRRSEYTILGKITSKAAHEGEEVEPHLKANTHLKEVDKDIFDDDDFYHQLLREFIERKTSVADPNDQVAMGRQWLAIQKLRSKVKKKVDTKASKGRKVRFHIHSKLANFMASIDHSSMSDEACSELYRGLFGQKSLVKE